MEPITPHRGTPIGGSFLFAGRFLIPCSGQQGCPSWKLFQSIKPAVNLSILRHSFAFESCLKIGVTARVDVSLRGVGVASAGGFAVPGRHGTFATQDTPKLSSPGARTASLGTRIRTPDQGTNQPRERPTDRRPRTPRNQDRIGTVNGKGRASDRLGLETITPCQASGRQIRHEKH
jgi:hypothetical protein